MTQKFYSSAFSDFNRWTGTGTPDHYNGMDWGVISYDFTTLTARTITFPITPGTGDPNDGSGGSVYPNLMPSADGSKIWVCAETKVYVVPTATDVADNTQTITPTGAYGGHTWTMLSDFGNTVTPDGKYVWTLTDSSSLPQTYKVWDVTAGAWVADLGHQPIPLFGGFLQSTAKPVFPPPRSGSDYTGFYVTNASYSPPDITFVRGIGTETKYSTITQVDVPTQGLSVIVPQWPSSASSGTISTQALSYTPHGAYDATRVDPFIYSLYASPVTPGLIYAWISDDTYTGTGNAPYALLKIDIIAGMQTIYPMNVASTYRFGTQIFVQEADGSTLGNTVFIFSNNDATLFARQVGFNGTSVSVGTEHVLSSSSGGGSVAPIVRLNAGTALSGAVYLAGYQDGGRAIFRGGDFGVPAGYGTFGGINPGTEGWDQLCFPAGIVSTSNKSAGDGTDMAQDRATGQIFQVKSVSGILQAEAREGWANLAGSPTRALASITDAATGAAIAGTYPSLCWIDSEGRGSVCYVDASSNVVRRDSFDGLLTLN